MNPFFLKELRSLGRRHYAPVLVPILLQVAGGLSPLLIMEGIAGNLEPHIARVILSLIVLMLATMLIGTVAGWTLGMRVFAEETRQDTLEGLRLVPQPGWRWLLQKLAFPLYGCLLVLAVVLPLNAALVIRGHFRPSELVLPLVFGGVAAGTAFSAALLSPLGRGAIRARLGGTLSQMLGNGHRLLPYWIGLLLLNFTYRWILSIVTPGSLTFPVDRFYATRLPTDLGLALLAGSFWLCALMSALHAADPGKRLYEGAARFTAAGALAMAYYLYVGYAWARSPDLQRVIMVVGLPAAALLFKVMEGRRKRMRREDRLGRWEIRQLERWVGNPVLIRDLRVALRPAALLTQGSIVALVLVCTCLIMGYAYGGNFIFWTGFTPGLPRWRVTLNAALVMGMVLGIWGCIPSFLTVGARALHHWQGERRANTLGQLWSSPLSSRQIVTGRWMGALLIGLTRCAPLVALTLTATLVSERGRGLDLMLPLGAWLLSLGLAMSAGFAGAARKPMKGRDLLAPSVLALGLMLTEIGVLIWAMARMESWNNLSLTTVLQTFSVAATLTNILCGYGLFSRSISDLNALREQEAAA